MGNSHSESGIIETFDIKFTLSVSDSDVKQPKINHTSEVFAWWPMSYFFIQLGIGD